MIDVSMKSGKIIGVISLDNISNIGDDILGDITEFIINNTGAKVRRIHFIGEKKNKFLILVTRILAAIAYGLFSGNFRYKLIYQTYKLRLTKYFKEKLRDLDAIVYAIGMLKFSTQDLSYIFDIINQLASVYNIPVFMSALSVANGNSKDWRYLQLVRAVNMSCVKGITTRDGINGLDLLIKNYIQNTHIYCDFVGDPALWIPECYGVTRCVDSDIIGINVIRKNIYKDYGTAFSGNQLLSLYMSLISELDRRNMKWVMFCNGMLEDYKFGQEILKAANLSQEKLLPIPNNAKEFVYMISNFKAVFGARLHACITAFSLDVPVVGLLWDNKLKYFSETMGISSFFCNTNELKGELIVNKLQEAMAFEYDIHNRQIYKQKTIDSLKWFIDSIE